MLDPVHAGGGRPDASHADAMSNVGVLFSPGVGSRRTHISTAGFSLTHFRPPQLTRTPPFAELGFEPATVVALRAGMARRRANCLMPRGCPPRTFCGPSAHGRCRDRRRPALPALRDHLNVTGHHPATRVEMARHWPCERPAAATSRALIGRCLCCYMSGHSPGRLYEVGGSRVETPGPGGQRWLPGRTA